MLFEQASSRGHAQQTSNGILRFPFTIRNQFVTALSTLNGAKALRQEFLEYQRSFFKKIAANAEPKGYVFGDKNDRAKTFHFIEMLQRQQIVVNELKDGYKDSMFEKGTGYAVSLNQPMQLLIKAIFDKQLVYKDSLFYDITSWTMPLAFGLPYKETDNGNTGIYGKQLSPISFPMGEIIGGKTEYAYVFEWDELYAPRALYAFQQAGLITKVATNIFYMPMGSSSKQFGYGTITVPVKLQNISGEKLYTTVKEIAEKNAIKVYAVQSGNVLSGSDLGSSKFVSLTQPKIAMLVGPGVNATDAGELWHLLDQRVDIPATHLEITMFNRADISAYNTIVMVGGTYTELNKEKLKAWVQAGGNLILLEEAITWAAQNGISTVTFKRPKSPTDSTQRLPYTDREQIEGAQQMSGAIFGANVDLTHPLAYGYNQNVVSMFKANRVYMEKSKSPYATPFYYTDKPLQSGWMSRENAGAIKNSAAVIVQGLGSGRLIHIADNPNFRAFWLGGTKLMMNAIFFGRIIETGAARGE